MTKINTTELRSWGTNINSLNKEAADTLTEFKDLGTSLPDAYECSSSEAFVTNLTADLTKAINAHTAMGKLQDYMETVAENAENS